MGAEYIEKHFCLKRSRSPYDKFSSIEPNQIKELIRKIENINLAKGNLFVNKKEKQYLLDSVQIPVANKDLNAKSILSIKDLDYKRTNQKGLNFNEIIKLSDKRIILSRNKKKNETFKKSDFKKANVGVLITGRMKSSRLPKKALKK